MKSSALLAAIFLLIIPESGKASNDASWIKECQGNRLYIKADKLEVRENAIFVKDDSNHSYPLTHIFVDELGIFTTTESIRDSALGTVWNIVWCKTCGAYRSVDIRGLCVKCGNQP
ncbi:MAG: hypothetical protein A3E80_03935 [Chlamydiae bacterium RIFCSPHIGHO2_12_FULL_49_9]|nr:MAG: hypothetical protein A3E80_03935 [Chlamydiae bacterium RIFCSPHIGHO2_12_FULL_49_9]